MAEYKIEWVGTVKEVYFIKADSPEEAEVLWGLGQGTPGVSEIGDGETTIEEV